MARNATIFKVDLQISDMDRGYYGSHALTIARHPSETDERMMVRLLAFAVHGHERLVMTRGLSEVDEPDLWQLDLTGAVEHWIDLGQPDERRMARACGRAARVTVMPYAASTEIWWAGVAGKVARLANLAVLGVDPAAVAALAALTQRSMRMQATIQDGDIWFGDDAHTVETRLTVLQSPAQA